MSDAPPPVPKKKSLLRRFLPSTVPGCAAVLTLLFMIVAVAVVAAAFYFDSNNLPWRHAIGIPRIAIILLLVLLVPAVLFFALRLWLEGEKRLYPDIDNAWKAGIHALEEQGLDLKDLACFLVLGSRSIGQERAIMQTGQLDLRVDGVPDGPAPIHWYATPDEVFIFCSDSSWSSALSAKRQRHFEEFGPQKSRSLANVGSTLPKNLGTNKRNPPAGKAGNETVQLEQFLQGEGAGFASSLGFGTDPGAAKTVELDDYASRSEFDAAAISDSGTETAPIILSSVQATDRIGRLTYVCQQLVRVRQPLSPINGILSLLPQGAISRGSDDAAALEQAVKSDLSAIRTTLQVRCPVTALVTDLEREVGFRELMRRVGKERVSQQRFGRRFDCRSLPTPAEMETLVEGLSGTIEDWVYALFREDEALTRPGNQQLFMLLCDYRYNFKANLSRVLRYAFAYDREESSSEDGLLFSGCYLVATGERADQRAFVGGILKKLVDEQEVLEWTTDALLAQQRWERISRAGLFLALLMIALAIWQVFFMS